MHLLLLLSIIGKSCYLYNGTTCILVFYQPVLISKNNYMFIQKVY